MISVNFLYWLYLAPCYACLCSSILGGGGGEVYFHRQRIQSAQDHRGSWEGIHLQSVIKQEVNPLVMFISKQLRQRRRHQRRKGSKWFNEREINLVCSVPSCSLHKQTFHVNTIVLQQRKHIKGLVLEDNIRKQTNK